MRHLFTVFIIFVGLAFVCAGPLSAQTLRVQSGDHAGFTRLVIPIGAEREWDLTEQPDDQWRLTLTPPVDGFDTSTAFNLIQRDRLSGLITAETLSLNLACACEVTSFRHDTRFLVIDITDPDPDAPESADLDPTIAERAAAAGALPDLANLLRSPGDLPRVGLEEVVVPLLPNAPDTAAPNPRLAEAAEIMAEQLARAAASGLLDIAPRPPITLDARTDDRGMSPDHLPTHQEIVIVADVSPAPTKTAASWPSGALPIRAETAFDTILRSDVAIGPPRPEASCTNRPFNIADWSQGGGLYQNLGELRFNVYDERDDLITDSAIALAQHYLSYGFGAEARYWLEQIDNAPDALLHVAALVDGAETAPFIPVEFAENCSEGELLWRYMAGAVPDPLTGDDTAAIQRAYGTLPPELRDHMGPRLAVQLVEDGYAGTARNIRDILYRGGRLDTVALRMLDLDLGISLEVAPTHTRQELTDALRDDGADPVSVLTHALAFDRRVGALPTQARLTTADALIREVGSGSETDDLWRETLLGHAALGQVDDAINRLGNPARDAAARAEALTDLIAERVSVGDTAALLVLAHSYGRSWRPEGSAAGRIQVRAVAALREDGLFEAAQILRDVRRPLILPAPVAPPEEAVDDALIAWREADWPRLADTGRGTHAAIATRIVGLQADPPGALPPTAPPDLNVLSATLADSRELRTTILDLLAQPVLP